MKLLLPLCAILLIPCASANVFPSGEESGHTGYLTSDLELLGLVEPGFPILSPDGSMEANEQPWLWWIVRALAGSAVRGSLARAGGRAVLQRGAARRVTRRALADTRRARRARVSARTRRTLERTQTALEIVELANFSVENLQQQFRSICSNSTAECTAYEQQLADADYELAVREVEDHATYRTIVDDNWRYFDRGEFIVAPDGQVYRRTNARVCGGRICGRQVASRWDVRMPTAISLGSFSAFADNTGSQLGFAAEIEHQIHWALSVRAGGLWAPLAVQTSEGEALWDNVGGYVGGGAYLRPPSSSLRFRLGVGFGVMQSRLLEDTSRGSELASVSTPIMLASGMLGLSPTESIEVFASSGAIVLFNENGLSYDGAAEVQSAWLSFSAGLRYRFSLYQSY